MELRRKQRGHTVLCLKRAAMPAVMCALTLMAHSVWAEEETAAVAKTRAAEEIQATQTQVMETRAAEETQTAAAEETAASPAGTDGEILYEENKWNFVDGSMDVSHGIPEMAQGRLGRIREKGLLRVATEPYFAPQEFIDPSKEGQEQYVGSDMELARLIAERMGVELEIVPLEFSDVLTSVAAGEYDLAISGLSFTPARASSMEISKGYYYSAAAAGMGILIRKADRKELQSVEDLARYDIVAQSGSLQEMLMAENVPRYHQFRRVETVTDVYDAVENGEASAGAVDIETAIMYISNHPDCGLMLMKGVSFRLEDQFQGDRVAGPNGEIELLYFINGVIDEVLADGRYEKWFDEYSELASELGL